MSLAAVMVHVDSESDSTARVQTALALADRFQAALIGVAGLAPRPALVAGGVAVYTEPREDEVARARARLDEVGRTFRTQGQLLRQVEWRSALELPVDVIARESRAADLVIVGPRRRRDPLQVDPGVVLLRVGRPVLVVPDAVPPLALRRVVVAWKDRRECRRAVRDAIPLLRQAKEVLLLTIGESAAESTAETSLADVTRYLVRHGVIVAGEAHRVARGPVTADLLTFARDEQADLIVAGGYGHSRLGEWIFGGVTHDLLADSPVCCMLSH
jgi:nucleotide-binding universal stress UspA family protein